ncbi:hypothetical protein ACFX1S_022238 [Malus domestica]
MFFLFSWISLDGYFMHCLRWELGLCFQRYGIPDVSRMLRRKFLLRILQLLLHRKVSGGTECQSYLDV